MEDYKSEGERENQVVRNFFSCEFWELWSESGNIIWFGF